MHFDGAPPIKQFVLTSWREKWPEQTWSCRVQNRIRTAPMDHRVQLADALVSQAFISSNPNKLLVRNLRVCLQGELISYASVISAVAKHDDLEKAARKTENLYNLLLELVRTINRSRWPRVNENSIALCVALRKILQWLLRNAERYFNADDDSLTELNFRIINELTTQPRTAALLTIARFEENGAWSYIETDLAVVKNSATNSAFSEVINAACHHVSQVSRRSIEQQPVYKTDQQVCPPILMQIMLHVEKHRLDDVTALSRRLRLLAGICGLDKTRLVFTIIHSSVLCFAKSIETSTQHAWLCMLLTTVPPLIASIGSTSTSSSNADEFDESGFCAHVHAALLELLKTPNTLDNIDQLRTDFNVIQVLCGQLISERVLTQSQFADIDVQRSEQRARMVPNVGKDICGNPSLAKNAAETVEGVIRLLKQTVASFQQQQSADDQNLLQTVQTIFEADGIATIVAAAAATSKSDLENFVSNLNVFNETVKTPPQSSLTPGESVAQANIRMAVHDVSFLLLMQLTRDYGAAVLAKCPASSTSFVRKWIERWWTPPFNTVLTPVTVTPEVDERIVEQLTVTMRSNGEFQLQSTNWHHVHACAPRSLLDMIKAKLRGLISAEKLKDAITYTRTKLPLSAVMACAVVVARYVELPHRMRVSVINALLTSENNTDENTTTTALPLKQCCNSLFDKLSKWMTDEFIHRSTSKRLHPHEHCRVVADDFDDAFTESTRQGLVDPPQLGKFTECLRHMGLRRFVDRACEPILDEHCLDTVRKSADIAFALVSIDPEPTTCHLLRNFVTERILTTPSKFAHPSGDYLARFLVASLDYALNEAHHRQKSTLINPTATTAVANDSAAAASSSSNNNNPFISPFVYDPAAFTTNTLRLRRLYSCSTEHDLSPGGEAGASLQPPSEPLVVVIKEFIFFLSATLCTPLGFQKGPHADFALSFIRHCLRSSPVLSRTIKELMPVELLRCIGPTLATEDLDLLFATADLGNAATRRLVASIVLFADTRRQLPR